MKRDVHAALTAFYTPSVPFYKLRKLQNNLAWFSEIVATNYSSSCVGVHLASWKGYVHALPLNSESSPRCANTYISPSVEN